MLTHAAVSFIPKGEGLDPLNLRPLSVLPLVYRAWAAIRCSQCTLWQESWITDGQHGARKGHSCSDALYNITGQMEQAMVGEKSLFGCAIDFSKAFDHVPQAITPEILRRLGLDPLVLKPLEFMYANLQRYFKARGYIGLPFRATNGIMQGCPLSVFY